MPLHIHPRAKRCAAVPNVTEGVQQVVKCQMADTSGLGSDANVSGEASVAMTAEGTTEENGLEKNDNNKDTASTTSVTALDDGTSRSNSRSSSGAVESRDRCTATRPPAVHDSSNGTAGATSSVAQPSILTTSQTDIEMLQAENTLLRLALAEAQEKLRAALSSPRSTSGQSARPARSRSPSDVRSTCSGKEAQAGNGGGGGGVACVQMRRLLLKDERFLREEFLPFLNMDDFGR